jgi:hypothetical protein
MEYVKWKMGPNGTDYDFFTDGRGRPRRWGG